jgi:copper(I)-binding protein
VIAPRDAARRRPPRVRSRAGVATAVATASAAVGALLLTGCAAGQQVQTLKVRGANDGTNIGIGDIAVRGVGVMPPPSGTAYKKGSSAKLSVVLVNVGRTPDTLTSVTSSAFTGWSTSSSSGTSSSHQVSVPANSRVSFGVPDSKSVLTVSGLAASLYPGQSINIRFTFAKAGSVTVATPVQLTPSPGTAVVGGSPSSPPGGGDAPEPTDTHTPETTTTPTPTDSSAS